MEFFPSLDKVLFVFRKSIWIGLALLVLWLLWEAALHAFFAWFNEQLARRVGPMIATIIVWTKNHPIQFLLLIMVFYCFFVIIGAQLSKGLSIQKPPELSLTKHPPAEESIASPTTNLSPKSLSPEDISKAIGTAPILQQKEIAKHYIGLKVTWEGHLDNVTIVGDNVMIVLSPPGGGRYIGFQVNPNNYPGLGLLKRGAPIKVEGVISDLPGIFIQLKDVKIISY
jgi:hypothetical protein